MNVVDETQLLLNTCLIQHSMVFKVELRKSGNSFEICWGHSTYGTIIKSLLL